MADAIQRMTFILLFGADCIAIILELFEERLWAAELGMKLCFLIIASIRLIFFAET